MIKAVDNFEHAFVSRVTKEIIKKWWLFLTIGFIAGVGGFSYASFQSPQYQSRLTFALDEGGSDEGRSMAANLAAQFGLSIGGAKNVFTGDNILEIMTSRKIIERVLLSIDTFHGKDFTLAEYYIQTIAKPSGLKLPDNIHFLPKEDRLNFSYSKDSLLFKIYNTFQTAHISAWRPNKKLNIFELNVTTSNEQFTKKFTDKLIEATNAFYVEISSKKAKETLEILEQRVPAMREKLNTSISNKANVQDANLNPAFSQAQVPLLKEQTNTQVYGAAYAELFKNLEMARFQYLRSIPLMQIIDEADYPMKKINAGRLKTGFIFASLTVLISLFVFLVISVSKKMQHLF